MMSPRLSSLNAREVVTIRPMLPTPGIRRIRLRHPLSAWTALKARNENWARTRAALTPGSARRSSWPLSLGRCTDDNFRSERKGEQVCVRHRATCWITEVASCLSQTGAVHVTRCLRGRSSTPAHSCDAGPRRRWVQSSMPHMRITSMAADLQDGRANTARPVRCVA
jgi:hypothetical protein